MAAFQFPDPAVQTTVTNPITGSTYQWKEPPGKWVVTVTMRGGGTIIWEGDNPPDPIGDYKLWYSTDTLELYFHYCDAAGTCAWVPTSTPITMLEDLDNTVFDLSVLLNQVNQATSTNENEIQIIKDGLGQVDLQEVLDNGNTADKGAEFGGTVKVKATDTTADEDPLFAVEGDQANGGTGVNLLVARRHSNQGDQVRYYGPVVNNKEITTKEYIDEDQERQDIAIRILEGEIEQLAPSFERGSWNWDDGDGYVDTGEYVMHGEMTQEEYEKLLVPHNDTLLQCLTDAGSDQSARAQCSREYDEAIKDIPQPGDQFNTSQWHLTTDIEFSNYDAKGTLHTFEDVKVGQILDMVCEFGGFMVAEITEVDAGQWYETIHLKYKVLSAEGEAAGLTKVKIFTIDDSIDSGDLNNFVRKSGDTMEGNLNLGKNALTNVKNIGFIGNFNLNPTEQERWINFISKKPSGPDGYYGFKFDLTSGYTFNSRWQIICENSQKAPVADISGGGTPNVRFTADQTRISGRKRNPDYDSSDPDSNPDLITNNITVKHDQTKIYNLIDPDQPHAATNKQYVDDAVASVSHGDEGLFGASYWTLDTSMDRDEVTDGKFHWDGSELYMARSTASKHTWCPGAQGWRTTNAWVTIYSKDGDLMHTFEVNRINFKEKYGKKYIVEFEDAWDYKTRDLVDGEEYRIVIPGFLT